jgi:hypothetical protein
MDATTRIILHIIQVRALHHNITTSQKPSTITFSKPPITLIVLCIFLFFYSPSPLQFFRPKPKKKLTLHKDNNSKHENQPRQF